MSTSNATLARVVSPAGVAKYAATVAEDALAKFGPMKLKEQKLTSSSLAEFRMTSETESRRSAQKVRDVLLRHLLKELPFLEYMEFKKELKTGIGFSFKNSSAQRYARYINYLCRKYAVPAKLYVELNSTANVSAIEETLQTLGENVESTLLPNHWLVSAEWAVWNGRQTGPISRHLPLSFAQDAIEELVKNENYWVTINVGNFNRIYRTGACTTTMDIPHVKKLVTPERIFLFLPQVLQVLSTLSRASRYDYRAFSYSTNSEGSQR